MKLTVDRRTFGATFATAAAFTSPRSPKEILKHVKMVADAEVSLMATDQEHGATVRVLGATIDEPGCVILPVQDVTAILKSCDDMQLVVETDGTNIVIRGSQSEFSLPGDNPNLFPDQPQFPATGYHITSAADFKRMIQRTTYATSSEFVSCGLQGCVMDVYDDDVVMAATDSRRVVRMKCPVEHVGDISKVNRRPIFPKNTLRLIDKHIQDDDPPIHFVSDDKVLIVQTETAVIHGALESGRFPTYQSAFVDRFVPSITTKVGPVRSAVAQAAILTSLETLAVDFLFTSSGLTLSSYRQQGGRSKIAVPITHDGDPVSVSLQPGYLGDMLKSLGDDSDVSIDLTNPRRGVSFRTDDGFLCIVMPVSREKV